MTTKSSAAAHDLHDAIEAACLDTLRGIATQREQIEHDAYAAVLDARLSGVPWSKIGQALGVTGQAAHLRYHGKGCNRPRCEH